MRESATFQNPSNLTSETLFAKIQEAFGNKYYYDTRSPNLLGIQRPYGEATLFTIHTKDDNLIYLTTINPMVAPNEEEEAEVYEKIRGIAYN